MPELAFPDDGHAPAQAAEAADVPAVVRNVPGELLRPELPVALGGGCNLATLVPVPEAAVDENDGPVFGQDDVRLAGEIRSVEPEAVSRAEYYSAAEGAENTERLLDIVVFLDVVGSAE
mgnify:CR=1 FL=1